MTWFLRRFPIFFVAAIALNLCMSIGALVIGGHYLGDLLGGVAVGLLTVLLLYRLEKQWPEERMPLFRAKTRAPTGTKEELTKTGLNDS
jgi:membrane-associated phospholipid phosphatase